MADPSLIVGTVDWEAARADEAEAEIERLRAALGSALAIAEEARLEWDAAPEGMKAGKLLIALSGGCPGYRADIDAIHAALQTSISNPDNPEPAEGG